MNKRIFAIFTAVAFTISVASCGISTTTTTTKTGSNVAETAQNSQQTAAQTTEKSSYGIGETWTVDGQWSVTINSVTKTDYRNQFADKNPAAVYMVDYTYTNLGYEDKNGIMDGLYIDFSSGIVDSAGTMGYSYPGNITNYPQQVPVGATCNAQSCIGVDNTGNFKINFSTYDGNGNKQKAVFDITV